MMLKMLAKSMIWPSHWQAFLLAIYGPSSSPQELLALIKEN
jgi:hypothetical protein